MKKYLVLFIAFVGVLLLGSHTARVENSLWLPFEYGAAAGYLNVEDDRSHPFKFTATVNKFGFNADLDTAEESIWDADDLPTEGDGPARCFTVLGTTAALLVISSDNASGSPMKWMNSTGSVLGWPPTTAGMAT